MHDRAFVGLGASSKRILVIQAHQANIHAQKISHSIRVGMQRAAQWGAHVGRPAGVETSEDFLAKPSSVRVIEALGRGLSLRQAAE